MGDTKAFTATMSGTLLEGQALKQVRQEDPIALDFPVHLYDSKRHPASSCFTSGATLLLCRIKTCIPRTELSSLWLRETAISCCEWSMPSLAAAARPQSECYCNPCCCHLNQKHADPLMTGAFRHRYNASRVAALGKNAESAIFATGTNGAAANGMPPPYTLIMQEVSLLWFF